MDQEEIRDLGVAWIVLSLAFGNLLGGLNLESVSIAFLTVGIGFLLHELAHRVVARNFGLGARFEADYKMLGFAFLLSFAGFIFAAPGAVYTYGQRTGKQQMLISVAGPITNIILALIFAAVPGAIGNYGQNINIWLAVFNMIPIGGLDGESVLKYSKPVYASVTVVAVLLFLLL